MKKKFNKKYKKLILVIIKSNKTKQNPYKLKIKYKKKGFLNKLIKAISKL